MSPEYGAEKAQASWVQQNRELWLISDVCSGCRRGVYRLTISWVLPRCGCSAGGPSQAFCPFTHSSSGSRWCCTSCRKLHGKTLRNQKKGPRWNVSVITIINHNYNCRL